MRTQRTRAVVVGLLVLGAVTAGCGDNSIESRCSDQAKAARDAGGDYEATYESCVQSYQNGGG